MTGAAPTAVSLFAGVGGIDLALERAGFRVTTAVEIDRAARGVLADRFPRTILREDVTKVAADELRRDGFEPAGGLVAAGFPCQDLSVAGRRKGMGEGTRSGLYWHVVRLVADLRPTWVLLENVPGLLSATCICPGDGRCQDAGHKRECGDYVKKVWVPNHPHSVPGGSCVGGCIPSHGGVMGAVVGSLADLGYLGCARVLDAQFFGVPQRRRRVVIVGCLGDDRRPVEVLLEPEGGEGDPAAGHATGSDAAAALTAGAHGPGVSAPGRRHEDDVNLVVGALTTRAGNTQESRAVDVVQPLALRGRDDGAQLEVGPEGGPYNALRAGDGGSSRQSLVSITGEVTHALTAEGHDASEDGTGRGTPLIAFAWQAGGNNDASGAFAEDMSPTLPRKQTMAIQTETTVRRLTPRECERLQGFPDDWTLTSNGKPQADSPRYQQMGNAVAVPVFEWVCRRVARSST